MRKCRYTATDNKLIRQNYPKTGAVFCATLLNRSVNSIRARASKLGLVLNRGQWVKLCNKTKLDRTYTACITVVNKRGGKLLCTKTEYTGIRKKILWKCAKGHKWYASPSHILHSNSWCPKCAGVLPLNIAVFISYAQKRRGTCLTKRYKNSSTKLRFKCKEGHTWETKAINIIQSHWCPYCAGTSKYTVSQMKEIAKKHGGRCLSKQYKNGKTKVKFECCSGHTWKTTPTSVVNQHTWCPHCAGTCRDTIEKYKKIAKNRSGICLSKQYKNAHTKLKFKCSRGHTWSALPTHVSSKLSWCPQCHDRFKKSENFTRTVFENLFGYRFVTTRPTWLVNPNTGKRLELDGYCKTLGLAFEYQGRQHYEHVPIFKNNIYGNKQRDKIKKHMCKKNKITLIQVPDHSRYSISKKTYTIFSSIRKAGLL